MLTSGLVMRDNEHYMKQIEMKMSRQSKQEGIEGNGLESPVSDCAIQKIIDFGAQMAYNWEFQKVIDLGAQMMVSCRNREKG